MSPGAIRTSKVLARMSRGRLLSVLACPGSSQQPHPWPILEWSLNNMRIDLPCLLHLPDKNTVRNYSFARRSVRSTLNPPRAAARQVCRSSCRSCGTSCRRPDMLVMSLSLCWGHAIWRSSETIEIVVFPRRGSHFHGSRVPKPQE